MSDNCQTTPFYYVKKFRLAERGAKTGNGLQFIDGPAGVAEAPARHLCHHAPAGGDEGSHHEGRLVPHSAGAVLIHLYSGNRGKIRLRSRSQHGQRKIRRLLIRHAPKPDRHQKGRHLLLRQPIRGKFPHDIVKLFPAHLAAALLLYDQIVHPHPRFLPFTAA